LVEKEINEDSGDGDIIPDRKSDAGPASMDFESPAEGESQRDHDQRQIQHREQDMRQQNQVVEVEKKPVASESSVNAFFERMVSDVADQKKNRNAKSDQHAVSMFAPVAAKPDEVKAEAEKEKRESVESGVYRWKEFEIHG